MGTATYGTVRRLDMTAIADAIRAKRGASGSLAPSEMASAIANIPAGGGDFGGLVMRTITEASGSYSFIGSYVFANCTSLSVASFPACTRIDTRAFGDCTSLVVVSLPVCASIGSTAFGNCTSLSVASFPVCTSIGSYTFSNCTSLSVASLPVCTSIGTRAFSNCTSLVSLFFRASNMKSIVSTVFANTNSTFRICVPTSLVTYYQTLPGWSYFASRIEAFDDWEG